MKLIKIFKRYIHGHLLQFIGVIVILLLLNYIRSLFPLLISKIFGIISNDNTSTLPAFINNLFKGSVSHQLILCGAIMVITVVIRDLLNFSADVGFSLVSAGVGQNIQSDFYNRVQNLPYSYLNHAQTGDLIQRSINDINRVKRFIGQVIPMVLSAFIRFILYMLQMFLINKTIALIMLFPFLGMMTGAFIYFRKNSKVFTNIEEADGVLTADVQENLTGIRVVKAFNNEQYEIAKFKDKMDKLIEKWDILMKKMSSYYGIMDAVSYFMMLVSFVLSTIFVRNGNLTFAQATSLFLFVTTVIWPVRVIGRQLGEFNRSDIAGDRILEIVNEKTEYAIADGVEKPEIKGDILFKDVFFNFADSNKPTIKDINLHIKQGETIALVGKTGCGKSTLVSLLNRMLDCTSGTIYLDGVDIKKINKKYLRKNVGLILQEPFLFSRTIEENIGISLDKSKMNNDTVKTVARIAAVDNDIMKFTNGYQTIVGERGVTLSGGQKQRIAIARMLVDFKPIIIFDDSLSAVDTDTDIKIRKALAARDKKHTTIIITHRITTAMEADRIVVMEDGKISDVGTHKDLIKKDGLYKSIWDIQNHFEN